MFRHLLACVAILGLAGAANADTLSIPATGCGSCGGLDLMLDVTDNGGSFDVVLTYSAPASFAGDASQSFLTALGQAGFKAISGWTSVSLDMVTFDGNPVLGWSAPVEANTSANSLCTTGTSSDKVCTYGFVDLAGGGDAVFEFTVTGGTMLSTDSWHIGGQFVGQSSLTGQPGHIISESAPSPYVPEPNAALVFGVGLFVVSFARRRGALAFRPVG